MQHFFSLYHFIAEVPKNPLDEPEDELDETVFTQFCEKISTNQFFKDLEPYQMLSFYLNLAKKYYICGQKDYLQTSLNEALAFTNFPTVAQSEPIVKFNCLRDIYFKCVECKQSDIAEKCLSKLKEFPSDCFGHEIIFHCEWARIYAKFLSKSSFEFECLFYTGSSSSSSSSSDSKDSKEQISLLFNSLDLAYQATKEGDFIQLSLEEKITYYEYLIDLYLELKQSKGIEFNEQAKDLFENALGELKKSQKEGYRREVLLRLTEKKYKLGLYVEDIIDDCSDSSSDLLIEKVVERFSDLFAIHKEVGYSPWSPHNMYNSLCSALGMSGLTLKRKAELKVALIRFLSKSDQQDALIEEVSKAGGNIEALSVLLPFSIEVGQYGFVKQNLFSGAFFTEVAKTPEEAEKLADLLTILVKKMAQQTKYQNELGLNVYSVFFYWESLDVLNLPPLKQIEASLIFLECSQKFPENDRGRLVTKIEELIETIPAVNERKELLLKLNRIQLHLGLRYDDKTIQSFHADDRRIAIKQGITTTVAYALLWSIARAFVDPAKSLSHRLFKVLAPSALLLAGYLVAGRSDSRHGVNR